MTCNGCHGLVAEISQIFQCSGCKSVRYCGSECQKGHWKEHKVLCNAIQYLHNSEVEKCKKACSFSTHLTPKQRNQVVNLVGDRCMIDCCIEGKKEEALWDTGSMIALAGLQWLRERGIEVEILSLSEILGHDITLEGAGGSDIPYEGVAKLSVELDGTQLTVPFLVTKENVDTPILGTNVIKALVSDSSNQVDMLKGLFEKAEKKVDKVAISTLLATLQTVNANELSSVKVLKSGMVLKAGSVETVSCKIKSVVVNERTPVVFEPEVEELLPEGIKVHSSLMSLRKGNNTRVSVTVVNESDHDITLTGRLQLGELHQVNSVTPVEVQEVEVKPEEETKINVSSTEVKEKVLEIEKEKDRETEKEKEKVTKNKKTRLSSEQMKEKEKEMREK